MTENLPAVRDDQLTFELDQRRAKAYAESGYWPDAASVAQALVRIEAGRSLGLPPLVAMSEVHVIKGNPQLGAGALAALVKASGRYDYRVEQHTNEACTILFFDRETGEVIGESTFTAQDAETAELSKTNQSYRKYPRNMLFARAMSNGVAWFCPDVTLGRVYTPEDFPEAAEIVDPGENEPFIAGETVDDGLVEPNDEAIEWPDPTEQDETAYNTTLTVDN